jgi:Putative Actinobacterial Holin-X, holin superfamily III
MREDFMSPHPDSHSLGDLVSGLISDLSQLIHQEVDLARSEMTERASHVGGGISTLFVGGAVIYAGYCLMLVAAFIGLSQVIPTWLAAMSLGAANALIGLLVVARGRWQLRHLGGRSRQAKAGKSQ